MSERNDLHYDAFISYRHNEFDSFVAENLHKKLESFKLPKSVLSKVKSGKQKIERVFRDVDELPLTDNLSDPISKALLNSDYLITICTPRYPESRWCLKEIEVFLQTHPRDHILVVLAEDEPVNSFPEILCYEEIKTTNENGETVITKRELEPLAADTRGSNKKEVLKAMDIAVIKLCAAMFGLNYDDLKQRHREQRVRRLAMIFGSIGAAVLAFAIFATIMLIKISRQNEQLQDSFAASMAAASGNLIEDGRKKDAVYAVRGVLSIDDEEDYNANALKALYSGMGVYKTSDKYTAVTNYDANSYIYHYSVSPDSKYVLTSDQSALSIFDAATGNVAHSIPVTTSRIEACFCGNDKVLWSDAEGSYYYSFTAKESTPLDTPSNLMFYSSDDGEMTIAKGDSDDYMFYGIDSTGKTVFTTDLSKALDNSNYAVRSIDFYDGQVLFCLHNLEKYYVFMVDKADGKIVDTFDGNAFYEPVVCKKDGLLYVTESIANGPGFSFNIVAIDIASKEHLWELHIDDMDNSGGTIHLSDDMLYLCGLRQIVVVDRATGELQNSYMCPGFVVESWMSDDTLMVIFDNDSIYSYDAAGMSDYTDLMYDTKPEQDISVAIFARGELFCQFGASSYVIRYSNELSAVAEEVSEYYEFCGVDSYLEWEEIEDKEKYDIKPEFVETLFFSDDGKYLFVEFTDEVISIFDKETGKRIWSDTHKSDYSFVDFRYSNLTGSYILSSYEQSYIFDKEMRMVCETDMIVAETDDGFIISCTSFESGQCKVPYLDITELCQMADELLGDYEPADTVKQKYGLN